MDYKLRLEIYNRDKFICYLCNCLVIAGKKRYGYSLATLDHVVPRSKGGSDDAVNLKTCCNECNKKKKDTMPKNPWCVCIVSTGDLIDCSNTRERAKDRLWEIKKSPQYLNVELDITNKAKWNDRRV